MWNKKSQDEIKEHIFSALSKNVDYVNENILGIPASYLDREVFHQEASFLKNSPFMSTLVHNPNHIGCHTLGESEPFFRGTQAVELEALEVCAVDILKAKKDSYDGYIASGGTESNIQAVWIYRNYFIQMHGAQSNEIAILCTEDSHYSFDKAADILSIDCIKVPVGIEDRRVSSSEIVRSLNKANQAGKKYFIGIVNMMTTMFGSVDDIDKFVTAFAETGFDYKLHVDGAYGGFYYPFTENEGKLTFENKHITSFTLDAHKMAQAPYGTGVFLIRKDYIHYANTASASYVEGQDFTFIGSRSGANAIAVWMILMKNGPYGWQEKIFILQKRTEWICKQLDLLRVRYFRHSKSNIITLKNENGIADVAKEFGLVPDNHHQPKWFKIVIMDHVKMEKLMPLIERIKGLK